MPSDNYTIEITAEDEASDDLERVGTEARDTAGEIDESGDAAQESGQKARDSSEGFDELVTEMTGIEPTAVTAKSGLMALATGIAAVGAAAAKNTVQVASFVAELDSAAAQAGLSANELQKWRVAGQLVGVQADSMQDAMKELRIRMGEARAEGKDTTRALDAMGLSFSDLRSDLSDTDAVMREMLRRISQIEDPMRRQAVAAQVFGEEAGPKLSRAMGEGAKGIDQLLGKAEQMQAKFGDDLVEASQDTAEAWVGLGQEWKAFKTEAAEPLIPVLEANVATWTAFVEEVQTAEPLIFTVSKAAKAGLSTFFGYSEAVDQAAKSQKKLNRQAAAGAGLIGEAFGDEIDTALQSVASFEDKAIDGLISAMKSLNGHLEDSEEKTKSFTRQRKKSAEVTQEAAKLRLQALRAESEIKAANLRFEAELLEIRASSKEGAEKRLAIVKARKRKQEEVAEAQKEKAEELQDFLDESVERTSSAIKALADEAREVGEIFSDATNESPGPDQETLGEGDGEPNFEEKTRRVRKLNAELRRTGREFQNFRSTPRTFRNIGASLTNATAELSNFGVQLAEAMNQAEGMKAAQKGASAAASTLGSVGAQAATLIGEGWREQAGVRAIFEAAAAAAALGSALLGNPAGYAAAAQHAVAASMFGAIAAGAGTNPNAGRRGGASAGGATAGGTGGTGGTTEPSRTSARERTEPRNPRPVEIAVDMRDSTHFGRTGPETEKQVAEASRNGAAQVFK